MRPRILTAVCLGLCVSSGFQVHATVLETNDWDNLARPGWDYSPGGRPSIDNTTDTPSGGGALKFTYDAGSYSTSFSGGIAGYYLGPPGITDVYVGHWMKYSPGFVFNANNTKIDFAVLQDTGALGFPGNLATTWGGGGGNITGTNQIVWGNGTMNHWCNVTMASAPVGRWAWFEFHAMLNTPGQSDGIFDVWVDDVQCAHYTDVQYRDASVTTGWGLIKHTAEWGGGGGTVPAQQYWWVDHTVISTTRIGRPGSAPAVGDSTPPSPPVGLRIQ